MAFFSALSSSIGKKILLFGLRHIDILDKDPSDFVSVDVGKRTTLEVRDVGLHIKKLIALLHLRLPPELRLSKAHVDLFRATVVFEFGVPQIIIELDGLQIRADVSETATEELAKDSPDQVAVNQPKSRTRAGSPFRGRASDSDSDASSDFDSPEIPTVDGLAKSFIREEPAEEIRELEEALNSQAESLHESVASSADGEYDESEGMGAGLGLPGVIRNLLNTALDRLQIVATHIDIRFDQHLPPESDHISIDSEHTLVTINFEFERVSIDSLTSPEPNVDVAATPSAPDSRSISGKRKLHVENICGRLISNAGSFASLSRVSRPSSPLDTRSDRSSHKSSSDSSSKRASPRQPSPLPHKSFDGPPERRVLSLSVSEDDRSEIRSTPPDVEHEDQLAQSTLTTDEDRFADADAVSDDGYDNRIPPTDYAQTRMGESSILYDEEGFLDYAMENDMFRSEHGAFSGELAPPRFSGHSDMWGMDGANSTHGVRPGPPGARSEDGVVPEYQEIPSSPRLLPHSETEDYSPEALLDNLIAAAHHPPPNPPNPPSPAEASPPDEDLAQSKIFTHDEAESMYMSAMSAAPLDASRRPQVPGGWDSASSSSRSTSSQASSEPVHEFMIESNILPPAAEAEEGCETPRPGSRQSPLLDRDDGQEKYPRGLEGDGTAPRTGGISVANKVSKVFLTVDEINVWFPLGLAEDSGRNEASTAATPAPQEPQVKFASSAAPEDSLFQDMPGSFSFYAHSTSDRRRKGSSGDAEASRPRLTTKSSYLPNTAHSETKGSPMNVSVEVGSVIGHVDLSTSRMLFQMAQKFLQAMTAGSSDDTRKPEEPNENEAASSPVFELSIKYIGVAWFEQLMASSVIESRDTQDFPRLETNPVEAIIRVGLGSMVIATNEYNESKVLIRKFALSSLDQDIISFQQPKSRSRRSVGGSIGMENDVEIIFQHPPVNRVKIITRPLNFMFDMQKLDEALSSYGGFSGVLELGNSISSNTSLQNPSMPPVQQRTRVVHFGDTPQKPSPPNPLSALKVDIQVGDVQFTLRGRTCALQLQTSPVRIAVRQGNVRMKISEIQLSGPYSHSTQNTVPLLVDIRDTEVTFLFAPQEEDLTRLISMITPSKDPYENDGDILIDTLLRQRRKGSVVRVELAHVGLRMSELDHLQTLEALGAEISKLSKVTKYLPDDDRPGILTLAVVHNLHANVMVNERIGEVSVSCRDAQVAHVGLPTLFALEIGNVAVSREDESLVGEVNPLKGHDQLPMIMARIIGDEIEPVVKAKVFNVCVEYRVSTVMAALGISEDGTMDDIALGLASSVSTITGGTSPKTLSRQTSSASDASGPATKPFHVDLLLRNCGIGLNPRKIPSKGLFVLTDAHFAATLAKKDDFDLTVELRKASIHAIDDVARLDEPNDVPPSPSPVSSLGNRQLHDLRQSGFVSLGSISAAKCTVKIAGDGKDQPQVVDVEFKNDLFVLESCADSTQTLGDILNGLQPPTAPSTAERYRTVVPLQEMMASFTGETFSAADNMEPEEFMEDADRVADEVPTNLEYVGSFYNPDSVPTEEEMGDSMLGEDDLSHLAAPPATRQRGERVLLESFQEQYEITQGEDKFDFDDNYFADSDSDIKGTARKWDSKNNQYHLSNEFKVPDAPLKVRIRDMNIVWNLFDGYDWPRTRQIITQAVDDVEARAEERRNKARDEDDANVFIEEDFLFNSVWIGVPIKDEKGALARRINHDIDDAVSETGSYATSTASRATGATARPDSRTKARRRRLKLERSKHHKITFELTDVALDLVVFPPGTGETQNSLNVRVRNFEIFDHIPSSTWKKFATSLQHPSEREMGRPMINLELLTVRPVDDLPASELVLRVTVQPLRLHVDQDALDFITRFFEFKDDEAPSESEKGEQPFLQRVEVNTVTLKLDYKPKKVDYAGLRSGHTTEFMNFFILDGADIILRRAILYGITSFDKLHKTLNDVWMPDVKRNQLPGVLAGLAPVRNIVNVTTGVRDLVVIPVREYKKDGRIFRSLQKGATTFARNTTSEVFRLGAKIAIGTQNILEGAETFLSPQASSSRSPQTNPDWEDLGMSSDDGGDEPRAVSNYANQPIGVMAGLRGAARHLERDLLTARDAIIAIPGEVMESGSGVGAARAFARRAPTVILKPSIGVTKAVSHALLGVGNALDKDSRRKIEDKYKSY
jgi:autophagy-related protein 2